MMKQIKKVSYLLLVGGNPLPNVVAKLLQGTR
jgi:hypothetical protein